MKGVTWKEYLQDKLGFFCDAVENDKVPCQEQCFYCLKKQLKK